MNTVSLVRQGRRYVQTSIGANYQTFIIPEGYTINGGVVYSSDGHRCHLAVHILSEYPQIIDITGACPVLRPL